MSTLRYIINIIPIFLLSLTAMAQEVTSVADTTSSVAVKDSMQVTHVDSVFVINRAPAGPSEDTLALKMPVYQGFYINVDIYNPIATLWRDGRFEFVVSADLSLWHRLFPVVEYGMMFMNHDYTDYKYKSDGLFVRAGATYNFINTKSDRKFDHMFGIGVRYAYSNVNYTLYDANISETYWKEEAQKSNDKKTVNLGWVEFVASVRVQVYKDFFMGINARVKTFMHYYEPCTNYPTYIPGYGKYTDNGVAVGLEYTLTYRIPSKKVKEFRSANGL